MPAFVGVLVGFVVRAWLATLRLRLVGGERVASARPLVLAFWHGQQLALLRWARLVPMAALVSASRDGEIAARALAALGVATARGSSSRQGASGLRAAVRLLRGGRSAAFAVDGPRGPARVVRHGGHGVGAGLAAKLARTTVVPMAAACSRAVVLRSWDRFEVPLPFTTVAVALGPELGPEVPPELLARALDEASAAARAALDAR